MPNEKLQPDLTPPGQSIARGLAEAFVVQGQAEMGAASANMMTSYVTGQRPTGIEAAYAKGGEMMVARMREEWDQDLTRKFDALYGEDMQRQMAELDTQWEEATKLHEIPLTEEQIAQAGDTSAAPNVPDKGYRTFDPVTGEPSYLRTGTPESRDHWRNATQALYQGKQKLVMDYLDAAAQYPNSPGIQAKAESLFESMVQSVETEKLLTEQAEARSRMELRDEQIAASQAEREEAERTRGAKETAGRKLLTEIGDYTPEEVEQMAPEDVEAELALDATRRQREQEDIELGGQRAEAEAQAAMGTKIALERGIDPGTLEDDDLRALAMQDAMETERTSKQVQASLASKEPLPPHAKLETLMDEVKWSQVGQNAIQAELNMKTAERTQAVQDIVNDRLKTLPASERHAESLAYQTIVRDAEAAVPQVNQGDIANRVVAKMAYNKARQSPQFIEKQVFGRGYDSLEDALSKQYPDVFKLHVKANPRKPLSPENSAGMDQVRQSSDPYGEPVKSTEPDLPRRPPTPEQVQGALKLAAVGKARAGQGTLAKAAQQSLLLPVSTAPGQGPLDVPAARVKMAIDVLERALAEKHAVIDTMAIEQVTHPMPQEEYLGQIDHLEDMSVPLQEAKDFLISMLPAVQGKQKKKEQDQARKEAARRARAVKDAWRAEMKKLGYDPDDLEDEMPAGWVPTVER
jgi:hypothetical protein